MSDEHPIIYKIRVPLGDLELPAGTQRLHVSALPDGEGSAQMVKIGLGAPSRETREIEFFVCREEDWFDLLSARALWLHFNGPPDDWWIRAVKVEDFGVESLLLPGDWKLKIRERQAQAPGYDFRTWCADGLPGVGRLAN